MIRMVAQPGNILTIWQRRVLITYTVPSLTFSCRHVSFFLTLSFLLTLSWFIAGFYLATAADDAVVKLWDLRRLSNFKTISLENNYEVKALKFDHSGTYLAVAGTDVRYVLA